MLIRPDERQRISEICREEMEDANRRITDRLRDIECRPKCGDEDEFEFLRRFYEDLTDNGWTKEDEECLRSMSDVTTDEVKQLMREGFRRSPVQPPPTFKFLINVTRRPEGESPTPHQPVTSGSDAIPTAERERLANLLDEQLKEAARDIVEHLQLSDTKSAVVTERLELAHGHIIGHFMPLV